MNHRSVAAIGLALALAASRGALVHAQAAPANAARGTRFEQEIFVNAGLLAAVRGSSQQIISDTKANLTSITGAPATVDFDHTPNGFGIGSELVFPQLHLSASVDYQRFGKEVRTGTSRVGPVLVTDRAVEKLSRTINMGGNYQYRIKKNVVFSGGGGINFWQLLEEAGVKIERDGVPTPLADDETSHTYTGIGPFWNAGVKVGVLPRTELLFEYRGTKLKDATTGVDAMFNQAKVGVAILLLKRNVVP